MPEAVIVATGRSPIGRANKGSLVGVRPDDLMATVVDGVLDQVPQLSEVGFDDLMVGCAQPAGMHGFNIARNISLLSGLPDVPGVTINRYCASSLQAIRMAFHAIKAGEGDAYIAGGVETVSQFQHGIADIGPHNPKITRAEERTEMRERGGSSPWEPGEGLPDLYISMGQTAENVRELTGVTREQMDEFAVRSHELAIKAAAAGITAREIVAVKAVDGSTVSDDDGPRANTTVEVLSALRPVFRPDGEVTAGNSCPLNDGAAATVIMNATRASELGMQPRARIVASALSAINPEIMGLGPVGATEKLLRSTGLTMNDIDLVEINEAFAAQALPSADRLGIDLDKLNVHGGAIALGHPFGATGSRMITTLTNALEVQDKTLGLATLCIGGGQGMALLIERLT